MAMQMTFSCELRVNTGTLSLLSNRDVVATLSRPCACYLRTVLFKNNGFLECQ